MYINVEREKREIDWYRQTQTGRKCMKAKKKIWLIDRLADRQTDWLLNWGGREEGSLI